MSQQDFSHAALVLLGHGSTRNTGSAAPVYLQAGELRARSVFGEVREAFWKQEPRVTEVLSDITMTNVFLAPLFISEGYFAEEAIPRELGFRTGQGEFSRVQRRGAQTLFYCKPLGTHDTMTAVVLARAREIVDKFPFPRAPLPQETTLFIAGHGTDKNEDSRKSIERQVERVGGLNSYACVHGVFLDEEPRVGECYGMAETRNIAVVPYFISDGMHTQQDIPVMLGEPERIVRQRLQNGQPPWRNPTERKGKLVWYASSVGSHPQIAEVILERVGEAAQWV